MWIRSSLGSRISKTADLLAVWEYLLPHIFFNCHLLCTLSYSISVLKVDKSVYLYTDLSL